MFRWIIKILRDERGFVNTLFSYLGSQKRGDTPNIMDYQWANVPKLQESLSSNLLGRIGNPSKYSYNDAFTIDQPGIEKQAEGVISSKLGSSPKLQSDIQDISNRYYEAQKTQMEDRFGEEQTAQKNMYNRLGLASSTPGLAASTNLGRKQENELGVLSADIANQGIDREMQAMKLAEDITNQYLTQGQALGQTQRASQQYSQGMSMQDIIRKAEEESMINQSIMNYLGQGAVSPDQQYSSEVFNWQQPNIWDYIGSGYNEQMNKLQDPSGLVNKILGGSNSSSGTVGNTGKTQSQILGFNTAKYR